MLNYWLIWITAFWKQFSQVTGLKLNCRTVSSRVVHWLCSGLFRSEESGRSLPAISLVRATLVFVVSHLSLVFGPVWAGDAKWTESEQAEDTHKWPRLLNWIKPSPAGQPATHFETRLRCISTLLGFWHPLNPHGTDHGLVCNTLCDKWTRDRWPSFSWGVAHGGATADRWNEWMNGFLLWLVATRAQKNACVNDNCTGCVHARLKPQERRFCFPSSSCAASRTSPPGQEDVLSQVPIRPITTPMHPPPPPLFSFPRSRLDDLSVGISSPSPALLPPCLRASATPQEVHKLVKIYCTDDSPTLQQGVQATAAADKRNG